MEAQNNQVHLAEGDGQHGPAQGPLGALIRKQSMDKDELGDRMKEYEAVEAQARFMPLLPIIARLDGRSFHNFTRGMRRPFDEAFTACMIGTTRFLVQETGAMIGYTQSDEITLVWHQQDRNSQLWFDARKQKMNSQLAAQATLEFNRLVAELFPPEVAQRRPTFDCRMWQVPNRTEAANAILWREWDATKNAISMAASTYFSPARLYGLNGAQRQELLFAEKGINFNDYPEHFKRGAFIQRKVVDTPFAADEIESLPPKHAARTNPDLVVTRAVVSEMRLPSLKTISNREAVLFDGALPA